MKDGGYVKIGSVCDIQNGFAFDSKLFNAGGEGLPLIRIRDIKRGYSETFTTEKCDDVFLVQEGDFLIGMDGEFNIGQWKSGTALLNQRVCKLVPSSKVLPKFIYYCIPKALKDIEARTAYATVKHLSSKQIKEICIPDLPLPKQQRIVDVLDQEFAKIDALKANAEKSLQAAKDLFQATMKKELEPKAGWKQYCLKDVCTEYGDYGMSLPSKPYDGIRYLRITDITEWGELNDDRVSVDAEYVEERYMVRDGDILFARTGATVGKTLVYEDKFGSCCYAGYLIRYRPDQSIVLPRMLYFITHSASYFEWVAISQKSATLPNISAKLYNAYELLLPSIQEQERIVARLDDLNDKCKNLQENYQKTLSLCDDLKQSLLRKAFNGEL